MPSNTSIKSSYIKIAMKTPSSEHPYQQFFSLSKTAFASIAIAISRIHHQRNSSCIAHSSCRHTVRSPRVHSYIGIADKVRRAENGLLPTLAISRAEGGSMNRASIARPRDRVIYSGESCSVKVSLSLIINRFCINWWGSTLCMVLEPGLRSNGREFFNKTTKDDEGRWWLMENAEGRRRMIENGRRENWNSRRMTKLTRRNENWRWLRGRSSDFDAQRFWSIRSRSFITKLSSAREERIQEASGWLCQRYSEQCLETTFSTGKKSKLLYVG